jgi:outer membrane protein
VGGSSENAGGFLREAAWESSKVKQNIVVRSLLVLGFAVALQAQTAPTKVGIINIQQAIISTKDGQTAVKTLQERFNPRQKELQDKQAEIQQLQQQLQRGANTLSQEALGKLRQDIDDKQRQLQRAGEDAQMEFEQAQQSTFAGISQKMQAVIDKFARDSGYALIIDVSTPQSGVLFASNSIDITKDVITAFDADTSSSAAAPAAAKPAPAAAKPAAAAKP